MIFFPLRTICVLTLLCTSSANFAQQPDLGDASSFAVFTGIGAFNNGGTTMVTGDIGTNNGPFTGFPPGTVNGTIHVQDPVSLQAAIDVGLAYSFLSAVTCDVVLGVGLGNNQVLPPSTYCVGAAATLNGDLILDGQGDPDALFIFQIDGALSTGVNSRVMLINGASLCNVYWQINGAVELGGFSTFLGTFIANGQISALEGASVSGRALATVGAISLNNNVIAVGLPPTPSVIAANGPITFCEGDNVILSGNMEGVWSTGEMAATITVSTSGDYFVTNSTICSSEVSNQITVTVNPLPTVTITPGTANFCQGEDAVLTADASSNVSYEWSTGETTQSITVATTGAYSVTVTDTNGCMASASASATVDALPVVTITAGGPTTFCEGGDVSLCASNGTTYLWNTGATGQCITVSATGSYTVTLADANDCSATASIDVTENPSPSCAITGTLTFCTGGSTELCASPGFASYLWSSGATSNCITVTSAANYSVTVTDASGCAGVCSQSVTENPVPSCDITGNATFCAGGSTELCASTGFASYLWSTGARSNCITVTSTGDYSVTVTDADGCISTCDQLVISDDVIPPVITCPIDMTVECGESTIPINTGTATATDNCTVLLDIQFDDVIVSGDFCPQANRILRTWTATDGSQNGTTCVQTITIEDTTTPSVECPAAITVACVAPLPAVNIGLVIVSDLCDQSVSVTHTGDIITDQFCQNSYVLSRTYRATDDCGNFKECSQIIEVIDLTPPTISLNNPLFTGGDTVTVLCFGQDPDWSLPTYDAGSVTATDDCGSGVSLAFNRTLEDEGTCAEDGYINLFRLTWTATDLCGNSSNLVLFLSLIDTIPPIIFGVPDDITVNCDEIPAIPESIYATDECLCACDIFFEESLLTSACLNNQVLVRTWTATDRCGNTATETQNITFVDSVGPQWEIEIPEIGIVEDGAILEYACEEGGIPAFFSNLNKENVYDPISCGSAFVLSFDINATVSNDCKADGYLEQETYRWSGVDECGNESELVLMVRLVDREAPVLINVPGTTCLSDPALDEVTAIDNCTQPTIRFWDVNVTNACGVEVIRRTYTAVDDCGNTSRATTVIIPDSETNPIIAFSNPILMGLETGDTMRSDRAATSGQYTSFNLSDVIVENSCEENMAMSFSETLIAMGDCSINGVVALIEVEWTATDICGNMSEISIIVQVIDRSGPVFIDFEAEITIGCNDTIPVAKAKDTFGEVIMTTVDTLILGDCDFEYSVQRLVTATDLCGNTTTKQQIIQVGNGEGPTIEGVDSMICEALTLTDVTAYDYCAGEFVPVTVRQDTVESPCEGLIIRRTWTAVNSCGYVSESSQLVTLYDETPPIISIPAYSVIRNYGDQELHSVYLRQIYVVEDLNALNENSVVVSDDCGQTIIPVFTLVITQPEECEEAGYFEERVYTWIATDACGNSTSLSFAVNIIDDIPPFLYGVPGAARIECAPLPPVPEVFTDDTTGLGTIEYTQTIEEGDQTGVFIVTRKWVATDACGNTSVDVQTITWIPDTILECAIILPEDVEYNSHGIVIRSEFTGGVTYDWEIVGEECFIQGGQNTPEITIYVGWSTVEIILTVTDSYGCSSVCTTFLDCSSAYSLSSTESTLEKTPREDSVIRNNKTIGSSTASLQNLSLWPNPARERVFLNFDSYVEGVVEIRLTTSFGKAILSNKITAQIGANSYAIDVSEVPKGSYLAQVKTEREILTKVIIVL